MDVRVCAPIRERQRYKTALIGPQGLALLGSRQLVSFLSDPRIHALDFRSSRMEVWRATPDTAWGVAASVDRVWAVCGIGPDADRHLFEYDLAGHEMSEPLRCPDGTGSYITHDGRNLFVCQWYNQRVFRLGRDGAFELVLTAHRGICGIAAVGECLLLLTTSDENSNGYFIARYDLSDAAAGATDVASVPFRARSLVWTGSELLTNHRERSEIVAFALPPDAEATVSNNR